MAEDSEHAILLRIEKLLLTLVKSQLGPLLDKELADQRMRQLYSLTGSITSDEAAKQLKCSKSTVIDTWRRWEALGLISKEGRQYQKVV